MNTVFQLSSHVTALELTHTARLPLPTPLLGAPPSGRARSAAAGRFERPTAALRPPRRGLRMDVDREANTPSRAPLRLGWQVPSVLRHRGREVAGDPLAIWRRLSCQSRSVPTQLI